MINTYLISVLSNCLSKCTLDVILLSSGLLLIPNFSSLQFNAFLNTIFLSQVTVGLIVAVLLDNTLEVERSKKDRGMPWLMKFRTFRGDNINEEFYTFPFNLNRFFPPR
jgi:hypothetical protein